MSTLGMGRIVDFLLGLLEVFNPILEPYRRFHEKLPRKAQQTLTAFMFILPFGILYAIFTILPIFQTFYISLHKWEIMGTNIRYIGLKNFERLRYLGGQLLRQPSRRSGRRAEELLRA